MRITRLCVCATNTDYADGAKTPCTKSASIDRYDPVRAMVLRRQIADIEQQIARIERTAEYARKRRALARRITVTMSVAAIASALTVVVLSVIVSVPIASALWVVPSALGGSAVAQSVAAMRESTVIRGLECRLDTLQSQLEAKREELAEVSRWKHAPTLADGLRLAAPRLSCGVSLRSVACSGMPST